MIKIHHLNNSRSQRVLWLLEELKVPYEIVFYERDKETMLAPESLKKVHSLGKAPILEDDDMIIAESAVIVEYLIKKYGTKEMSYPTELKETIGHSYWYHFSEGSMMPPLLLKLVFDKINSTPVPFFIKPIVSKISNKVLSSFVMPNVYRNLDFIEEHLKGKKYFIGNDLSGSDIMMSFPLEAAMGRINSKDNYTNILTFLDTIHERDAYKTALTKGGEYTYA